MLLFAVDPHLHHLTPARRIDDYPRTALEKLRWLILTASDRGCDALVLTGDVFDKASQPAWYVNLVIEVLMGSDVPIFTVVGNHDIPYNRLDYLDRTSLGTLLATNCIRRLNSEKPEKLGNIDIWGFNYEEQPRPLKGGRKGALRVAVNHHFYGALDTDSWDDDSVKKLKADALICGHDHVEYDPNKVGKTEVFRIGSLTRGAGHHYNIDRKPQALLLNDDGSYELLTVPHQPFRDVFSDAREELDSARRMTEFVERLDKSDKQAVEGDRGTLIERHLNDLDIPEQEREWTRECLQGASII